MSPRTSRGPLNRRSPGKFAVRSQGRAGRISRPSFLFVVPVMPCGGIVVRRGSIPAFAASRVNGSHRVDHLIVTAIHNVLQHGITGGEKSTKGDGPPRGRTPNRRPHATGNPDQPLEARPRDELHN